MTARWRNDISLSAILLGVILVTWCKLLTLQDTQGQHNSWFHLPPHCPSSAVPSSHAKKIAHDFRYDPPITYYAYVSVAMVTQQARLTRRIMLSSVAQIIFPHYLTKDMIFGGKNIKHKMYILIFSTTFLWNTSHSKKKSARYYYKRTQVFM